MHESSIVVPAELSAMRVTLLPTRETLFSINVVNIIGVNLGFAINAATIGAMANVWAGQWLGFPSP